MAYTELDSEDSLVKDQDLGVLGLKDQPRPVEEMAALELRTELLKKNPATTWPP